MLEALREAGWGAWPVMLFGLTSLILAISYAVKPRRRMLPLVVGFGIATILAGFLGTITGLQHAVSGLHQVTADRRWIFLIGLKEASNNLVMAFLLECVVTLVTTVGSYRQVKAAEAEGVAVAAKAA